MKEQGSLQTFDLLGTYVSLSADKTGRIVAVWAEGTELWCVVEKDNGEYFPVNIRYIKKVGA